MVSLNSELDSLDKNANIKFDSKTTLNSKFITLNVVRDSADNSFKEVTFS